VAFIRHASEDEEPDLRAAYDAVAGRGRVPANILRIHSLHPSSLTAHYAFYRTIMFGPSPLTRAQREMIAVAVSQLNHCRY
jgi:alkylhydroperoxidase family enzyme